MEPWGEKVGSLDQVGPDFAPRDEQDLYGPAS
jgi:hypothetical protein